MTIENWLEMATADADRRGLADLRPLLEALARATRALREAHLVVSQEGPLDPRRPGGPGGKAQPPVD